MVEDRLSSDKIAFPEIWRPLLPDYCVGRLKNTPRQSCLLAAKTRYVDAGAA
jgi:hypothetical protein